MKELLEMAGVVTWAQLVLGFVAIVLIFERILYFQSTRLNEGRLLTGIANQLRKRAYAEAIHESSHAGGPMGRILHSITTRHHLTRSELRGVAEDAVALELPKLEHNLRGLLTIVYLAPLTGMLGTVLGLMDVFMSVREAGGYVVQAQLAHGLFESLATTAIGLTLALICYLCYMYLSARAQQVLTRMNAASVNLVNIIIDARSYSSVVSIAEPVGADPVDGAVE